MLTPKELLLLHNLIDTGSRGRLPRPRLQALAVVPEWIAEDSVSGETFNHSDVIEVPSLPMDDIEVFFLAEDPQVRALNVFSSFLFLLTFRARNAH